MILERKTSVWEFGNFQRPSVLSRAESLLFNMSGLSERVQSGFGLVRPRNEFVAERESFWSARF